MLTTENLKAAAEIESRNARERARQEAEHALATRKLLVAAFEKRGLEVGPARTKPHAHEFLAYRDPKRRGCVRCPYPQWHPVHS